jgi:predicted phage replisome organizer
MADIKWIKIVTDIFDDEKIKYIETIPNGDETIVIWFRLLCLAGRSNNNGLLMMTNRIAYTEDMLASIFNRELKSIQLALSVFENLEMIERIDNKIYLTNWEKHQSAEKLSLIKEQTRLRVANHRAKRLESNANSVTKALQPSYSNATELELDLELEKEEDDLVTNYKDDFDELIELFQTEFKKPLSSTEIDKLLYWHGKVGVKYIKHALRESLIYRVLKITYVEKVLLNWQKDEITLEMLNQGIKSK